MWESLSAAFVREDDGELACPGCEDNYLHHGRVRVNNRVKEDGPAVVIDINGVGPIVESRNENPPGRRNSVEIELLCELCGPVGHLLIMQHKGKTYMTMELDDSKRMNEREKAWVKFRESDKAGAVVDVSTWCLQ